MDDEANERSPPSAHGSRLSSLGDDDLFEPVSLRDLDHGDGPGSASLRSSISADPDPSRFSEFSAAEAFELDVAAASGSDLSPDTSIRPSLSFTSLDSGEGASPQPLTTHWSKPRLQMPDIPQELVHLVDSAIMGRSDSIDQLKGIVSSHDREDLSGVSRSVVDALLATMGGVDDLDDGSGRGDTGNGTGAPPSMMLSSRAAVIAAELIPWLPWEGDTLSYMSPRTRMVKGLLSILRACTRNRAMCTAAGMLNVLLGSAERIFVVLSEGNAWNGALLCRCIEVLAGHSLSVADLHKWLGIVMRSLRTGWATELMSALERAMGSPEAKGPACTFEFDGESSGLLGPGESRWPFSNGYAFVTWIYIESFSDTLNTATAAASIAVAAAARSGKSSAMSAAAAASVLAGEGTAHMPRLFSFLSSDNNGIEAYFHGQFLVVETGSGKGKKASLHFTYAFKPQCWYCVGLEHHCKQGLLGKSESELKLYVDGKLHESRPFEFPRIAKPLAFCCIGTNPPPTMAGLQRKRRQCPLFAEMGPVYIFKEHIGPSKMTRLASRGGDALPLFGNAAGSPWFTVDNHMRSLADESVTLDANIEGNLHLLYHPSLLSGRLCPDASPSGASGQHRRPAEVLGLVHVAARLRPAESLWALACGGPLVLLPLMVSKVLKDSLEPVLGDLSVSAATASLSAPIFRIISIAIQHPGNNMELYRNKAPQLLSRIVQHLLQNLATLDSRKENSSDEEVVAAVVSLCQSQKHNHLVKVQLFSMLLLDLKMWSICNYSLQKKLLSSLADMVFTEASAMRDANALQMLLDGCRRCYWVVREIDSVNTFSLHGASKPVGEINALIDELLVVIELLVGASASTTVNDDVFCLVSFLVDCPQPNQVARVMHLIYRLIVQPNTSRAHMFAQSFIFSGGIDTMLVLLQREAKSGDYNYLNNASPRYPDDFPLEDPGCGKSSIDTIHQQVNQETYLSSGSCFHEDHPRTVTSCSSSMEVPLSSNIERKTSTSESQLLKNLGGMSFSISTDSARSNVYNIDKGDGILVGIIKLLGALIISGHLKLGSNSPNNLSGGLHEEGSAMFDDKISLLLFALQKAFHAAPQRLMTANVYMALLSATINVSSTDDGLDLYDSGHRFEHIQLLLVLLRSLTYAGRAFQLRAIQDLLFLACSHPENRRTVTCMEEWPEWILEVLISNYELGSCKNCDGVNISEIEDLIHSFLIIMLEHSMRHKDGWKDVEAVIHCAEWLSMVGGSSTGEQRGRREESMPVFKRRLLGGLLDFAARELQVQTQVIAAAAAGVAAECLSPQAAKAEAENAAHLSVALAENAIVILMLVEDHLRLQAQLFSSSHSIETLASPGSVHLPSVDLISLQKLGESMDTTGSRKSRLPNETSGLSLDVLVSMADANGQLSAAIMERLTAAAAAEPFESVRCAFVSYGSCASDIAEGWRYRSRMWYGVGLPPKEGTFGGGGTGWEAWRSSLEMDINGNWIEFSLVRKSIAMLQALLLDECGIGGGLGIGGGSGTGMGGMTALYQLLDSDQPFLCMLRMVLISMREEDIGEYGIFMRNSSIKDDISEALNFQSGNMLMLDGNKRFSRKPRSALLWSVLAPILNMPLSESKRQRVLVASCIFYSEVWHAVGRDRKPLRKNYLDAILPPFVAILRRWRPLLAGIHELTSSDGLNPLIVDDRALAADSLPVEAAIAMISPGWAAAFASPPAAMALAMIAAGAAGGETATPSRHTPLRRDTSMMARKATRLQTFSSFQKPPDFPSNSKSPPAPKDKAAAKAAALAAARDLERNAKIGSGRGLSAVAMATSAQRRSAGDIERAKRWNISEAMGTAWTECLQSVDSRSISGRDFSALSYKYVAVLVASLALARNMQRMEMDRRSQADILSRHIVSTGGQAWRKFIHCLIEMSVLFGPFSDFLCLPERVFWKLDLTESSLRMRQCLKRNYKGSDHLGAAADYENRQLEHVSSEGPDTIQQDMAEAAFAEKFTTSSVLVDAVSVEEGNEDDDQGETNIINNNIFDQDQHRTQLTGKLLNGQLDSRMPGAFDDQHILQFSSGLGHVPGQTDERVVIEIASAMVRPLKVVRGTFQVTTKRIRFIVDECTHQRSLDNLGTTCQKIDQDTDRSWLISSLHQMFSRRYLLRRSALELFLVDRSNIFFDFGTIEGRKNAYRAIVQSRPPNLNNVYLATQRPEQLLKRTQLMERWTRWEISNFEYLMELNTLAGRSYNDITQYPVFPWILADYSSKTLDLQNPSSYRDLSKPIGALNPERLKKFQERYSTFDDPVIPKFHYGSHYSSAGTVLYYLVRVEPFTTLSIQLQGGKFDHADRMFYDIGATWTGVLEDMSDVKELVPEMFYLPEALSNLNSIDFGTTQMGGKLDLVTLPPWADNPVDFIHKHRMALESEHVSAHLHEWIDLIFGYKQRGTEAVAVTNVFFYTTYEGMVDIDKISDPVQQRAMQDQIAYFGQTPSQLLITPHLKKLPLADVLHLQTIFRNPHELKPYFVPNSERCNVPASAIYASHDSVVVVDEHAPAAHVALHKWQPNTPDGHGTPFHFQHGKPLSTSTGGAFMRMFKGPLGSASDEWQFPRASAFAASGVRSSSVVAITCGKEIITGGHMDNSVKLISSDGAKTIETACGHCAPVTCIHISRDSNYLVTGSRDTTILLWRLHRVLISHVSNQINHSIPATNIPADSSVGATIVSSHLESNKRSHIEGPIHILRGHHGEIECCCVSSELGIVVSSSNASGVLLHSVRCGRLMRKLHASADAVCLSPGGVLLIWDQMEKKISTFTVNGIPIATTRLLSFTGRINCIEISADGEYAVIGTSSGGHDPQNSVVVRSHEGSDVFDNDDAESASSEVRMNRLVLPVPSICFLNLHTLEVFHTLVMESGQDITAIALDKDDTSLLVSTADKKLIVLTDPALSLKVLDHMLRLGWQGHGLLNT